MREIFNNTKFIYSFLEDYIRKYQRFAKGRLVDVGCGEKPFEYIFKNIDSYYGVDISPSPKVDLVCNALDLKIKSNSFDTVLCTQVLEHVEEPSRLISEISRILKQGGICILTVPHISRVHGHPNDFFRFTNYGLEYIFKKNGFEIMKIEGMGGFFLTIVYLIIFYLEEKLKRLSVILTPWICFFYLPFQGVDKNKNHPFNYIVVARKLSKTRVN